MVDRGRLSSRRFTSQFRILIAMSWAIPPVFGLGFLLLVVQLFSLEQLGQMMLAPPLPIYIVASQVLADVYFRRLVRPVNDYLEDPTPIREAKAFVATRRFTRHFWSAFLLYLVLAPVAVVASAALGYGFSPTAVDWLRLELTSLVVSIIVGLPIFFAVIDLFGEVYQFAKLDKSQISLTTKIFMVGALVPLLIDTMLVQYFWSKTGYFDLGTFAVWVVLELLAVVGAVMVTRSFRRSLEPLYSVIGQAPEDVDVARLRPRSIDEHGTIAWTYRNLIIGLKDHNLVLARKSELEEQLRQAQRLESVGMLAGGVAHDFNNILLIITMTASLLRKDSSQAEHDASVRDIQDAANRAASLTRQLLAFSRSQVLSPTVLDVDEVIAGLKNVLGRLLTSDIELVCELDAASNHVFIDRSQLEQVVINLVVNARDAIGEVPGKITIRTRTESSTMPDGTDSPWIVLEVADTGSGIAPDVLKRVFEPYFTTKEARGTGLGLATVFGIVSQSAGTVAASSEIGLGSVFTVRLPRTTQLLAKVTQEHSAPARGRFYKKRVLVAEDDATVRRLIAHLLENLGLIVVTAARGDEAIALIDAATEPFDLLVTDVVMPGARGPQVAQRFRERWAAPVLLASGYADQAALDDIGASGLPLLAKPFTADALVSRIAGLLDATSPRTKPT